MNDPDKIIKKLKMVEHREGGFFVESFRDKNNNVSLIYYLLKKNQKSHWHRLKKNEILHFYDGFPLNIYISKDEKNIRNVLLGRNLSLKEKFHVVIPAGSWFSMTSSGFFSLIGCTVSPGFNYSDFELASPGWEPVSDRT